MLIKIQGPSFKLCQQWSLHFIARACRSERIAMSAGFPRQSEISFLNFFNAGIKAGADLKIWSSNSLSCSRNLRLRKRLEDPVFFTKASCAREPILETTPSISCEKEKIFP